MENGKIPKTNLGQGNGLNQGRRRTTDGEPTAVAVESSVERKRPRRERSVPPE